VQGTNLYKVYNYHDSRDYGHKHDSRDYGHEQSGILSRLDGLGMVWYGMVGMIFCIACVKPCDP
jgi:hypothetical protein